MKHEVDKLNMEELNLSEDKRPFYHKNCAEILLIAANEKYELNLDDRFIKAVCPFGGGMQVEKTCGALIGSIAAIGLLYTEDKPSTNDKMKELTKKYIEEFEKKFGSINCSCIKEKHRDEVLGCNPVKLGAAEIFEQVVEK